MSSARVFVAANILFSACRPGPALGGLLFRLGQEERLVTCALAIEEAARNLEKKRPQWFPRLALFIPTIQRVPLGECPDDISLPANDGMLLGAAIAAGCAIFLTGDCGDFGHLYGRVIVGVRVLPPSEFNP